MGRKCTLLGPDAGTRKSGGKGHSLGRTGTMKRKARNRPQSRSRPRCLLGRLLCHPGGCVVGQQLPAAGRTDIPNTPCQDVCIVETPSASTFHRTTSTRTSQSHEEKETRRKRGAERRGVRGSVVGFPRGRVGRGRTFNFFQTPEKQLLFAANTQHPLPPQYPAGSSDSKLIWRSSWPSCQIVMTTQSGRVTLKSASLTKIETMRELHESPMQ